MRAFDRSKAFPLALCLAAVGCLAEWVASPIKGYPGDPPVDQRAEPYVQFSPYDDVEHAIRGRIAEAKKSIRVQAYSFTSRGIAQALVDAKGRGVDVRVLVDVGQRSARNSQIDFLTFGNIPVKLDASHPIAHSKVIVVDGEWVITGSYNYTEQAKKNSENALFLPDKAFARKYLANWDKHEPHCLPYEPPK